jgi:magnesium-transporting ATPase (P-type)
LTEREARRRLVVAGRNELERRAGPGLLREVTAQLVHPLALLLWAAAALAVAGGTPQLSVVIVVVILLNAAVAVIQERREAGRGPLTRPPAGSQWAGPRRPASGGGA